MTQTDLPSTEVHFAQVNEKTILPRAVDALLSIHFTGMLRLVSIADGKANMILNANSIVLSIIFAVLSRRPEHQSLILLIPLGILTIVCLVTSIYAILAARPKVITIKPTAVSMSNKNHDLISQVIFTKMSYNDFQKGMTSLIASDTQVYDSLLEGLYANGQVLQKKYKYLAMSYAMFLYGLSLAVISYLIVSFIR